MLILASSSPRRKELLRVAGVEFSVVAPHFEEDSVRGRSGRYADLVRKSALAKARDVARQKAGLILAADTIVVCDGEIMGKPTDEADARRMLCKLSGHWHTVYTGVAMLGAGFVNPASAGFTNPAPRTGSLKGEHCLLGYERTEVAFRRLSNSEIERYIATGEPVDKAGAYAIQGRGAALIRTMRGCYTNVIGLPIPKVLAMLAEFASLTVKE